MRIYTFLLATTSDAKINEYQCMISRLNQTILTDNEISILLYTLKDFS